MDQLAKSVPVAAPAMPRKRRRSPLEPLTDGLLALYTFLVDVIDYLMAPLQRLLGVQRMAYVFVLPNLLIFSIFILIPMLLNFYYTFTGGTDIFPQDRTWVGTENLEQIFDCQNFAQPKTCREDRFWKAAFNTTWFVITQVAVMVIVSLITALALNREVLGRGFFRGVFFYPVLLSPIVVALLWKWLLQQDGLLNAVVVEQLGRDRVPFLLNANWARFWVVVISVWAYMGFYTLILLAGLQAIPADLYEAASMDGANAWESFRQITMPLLMPTMLVVLILSMIRAVQVFDVVFAFTKGGPGTSTLYMVQYIYNNGFASPVKRYGIAAAASMLMAIVLLILTLSQLALRRREVM